MAKDKASRDARKARRLAMRAAVVPASVRLDPADLLGDIDAWNLRDEGGWLRFDARFGDGVRGYMRPLSGGDVIADAPGPLLALLAIGGARRAGFNEGPARFRHNVLAPADHIGGVGLEGTDHAEPVSGLQHLRHRSREALLADRLLAGRHAEGRGLPLYFVRAETDNSASIGALTDGIAFANLVVAVDNLCAAARTLGRPARVLAVGLDFGLEDVVSADAGEIARGIRSLMTRITDELRRRDLAPPVFLAVGEAGTARIADHPAIRAMWELAWCPGPHRLIVTTPSYVARQDRHGRVTEDGRQTLADLDAHALGAVEAGDDWLCPLPLLAEYRGAEIRVVFRSLSGLVIDPGDPFGAGPAAGFRVTGTDIPVGIASVAVAPDDPCALVLGCDRALTGAAPRLLHACALGPAADDLPANRSAIRDAWGADGLRRWALPADLPLHPAAPDAGREASR